MKVLNKTTYNVYEWADNENSRYQLSRNPTLEEYFGEVEQAYDGLFYARGYAPQKSQEIKEQEVRAVRNKYLSDYVDPFQLVIRWGTLSKTEQGYLIEYRQYLLDYPGQEDWWENEPMTYEEWLVAHHPVIDVESEAEV